MVARRPSVDQIRDLGAQFGLTLNSQERSAFRRAFKGSLASHARLDKLVAPSLALVIARSPGHRPQAFEDPFNAWRGKTDISSGADGLLKGKKVAIKDNIGSIDVGWTAFRGSDIDPPGVGDRGRAGLDAALKSRSSRLA